MSFLCLQLGRKHIMGILSSHCMSQFLKIMLALVLSLSIYIYMYIRTDTHTYINTYMCMCVYTHAHTLSHVWLIVAPRTIAHQPPMYMGFPREEYWNGLRFLLPHLIYPYRYTICSISSGEPSLSTIICHNLSSFLIGLWVH